MVIGIPYSSIDEARRILDDEIDKLDNEIAKVDKELEKMREDGFRLLMEASAYRRAAIEVDLSGEQAGLEHSIAGKLKQKRQLISRINALQKYMNGLETAEMGTEIAEFEKRLDELLPSE